MGTITDFSKFGHREREMAEKLLRTWREQGLPNDFYNDEVVIMMNDHSGYVFLANSDYQTAMMNGDTLESFYSCPQCGHEGFKEEMEHDGNTECEDYLKQIGLTIEDEAV